MMSVVSSLMTTWDCFNSFDLDVNVFSLSFDQFTVDQ